MPDVTISPIIRPFDLTITPPGSKSLTNRALVLGALSDGQTELQNVLLADDTLVMIECLKRLGFVLQIDEENRSATILGQRGGIDLSTADLFCANSGTTMRFLTALCTLGHGTFTLDGSERLRQRPMRPLVEMLRNLGARIECGDDGGAPLRIFAEGLAGGVARFESALSSQFLSALLMIAPYARHELRIDLVPPLVSWPYVAMTMRLMDEFGLTPELIRDPRTGTPQKIIVPQGHYRATELQIEPDATSASYFLAAAAINERSRVTIEGLGNRSLQGDVRCADILHKMGASLVFGKDFITLSGTETFEGTDIDLSDTPDLAPTIAVACLFAEGESKLRGLSTLLHKETDRLAALAAELQKLGAKVQVQEDSLAIAPPENVMPANIDTYDDHRMAMSFAIAGTKVPIVIRNAECAKKTYPAFFDEWTKFSR